ncbi:uncharacterized protein LOC134690127 [Mytilus trossulus]|uniref:uncharacterized protein LOC134690127 n=1 Tax=Mytilus trossulus TaxID=6551 RepID=UPI003004B614
MDSVSLDHSYLSDNQTVAELCLDEEIDVNQHIELECQEECVIASENPYEALKRTICTSLTFPYVYNTASSDHMQIIEHYPSSRSVYVKLTVIIHNDFSAKLYVHGIELSREHDIWLGLPSVYDNIASIEKLLSKLKSYTVCSGNHEQEFLDLTPVGSTIEHATDAQSCRGFKEQDFGAVKGTINYSSTVCNVSCLLLVQGNRCSPCTRLRRILISRKHRLEGKKGFLMAASVG